MKTFYEPGLGSMLVCDFDQTSRESEMTNSERITQEICRVVLAAALFVRGGKWAQYRGPTHDGVSPEMIRTNWSESPPREVRRVPVGPGLSSFTVSGGRAVTQVRRAVGEQPQDGWWVHPDYGIAIGYHYLGGQPNTPWEAVGPATNTWVSPQQTTDDPSSPLAADLNVWAHSFQRILTPHTARGSVIRDEGYFEQEPSAHQQTPAAIGAKGGNVGLLSGSVSWKQIPAMRAYRSSQLWGNDGSFGLW